MTKGISMAGAKLIYRKMVEGYEQGKELDPVNLAEEYDVWLMDEWSHVGLCIIVCLDDMRLVQQFVRGNPKILGSLIGKIVKLANMSVSPELIGELLPLIIERYWNEKV